MHIELFFPSDYEFHSFVFFPPFFLSVVVSGDGKYEGAYHFSLLANGFRKLFYLSRKRLPFYALKLIRWHTKSNVNQIQLHRLSFVTQLAEMKHREVM